MNRPQAQPHRAGPGRKQTRALAAMKRGKPATLRSPADIKRGATRKRKRRKGRKLHPLIRALQR